MNKTSFSSPSASAHLPWLVRANAAHITARWNFKATMLQSDQTHTTTATQSPSLTAASSMCCFSNTATKQSCSPAPSEFKLNAIFLRNNSLEAIARATVAAVLGAAVRVVRSSRARGRGAKGPHVEGRKNRPIFSSRRLLSPRSKRPGRYM